MVDWAKRAEGLLGLLLVLLLLVLGLFGLFGLLRFGFGLEELLLLLFPALEVDIVVCELKLTPPTELCPVLAAVLPDPACSPAAAADER
jgi:hypothetical protein